MTTNDGYARPELLADPAEVWERHDDPDLRVVDCGSPEGYDRAHIPGAVRLGHGDYRAGQPRPEPWDPWLKNPARPLHVVTPPQVAILMAGLGVSEGTTVVAYDDLNGSFASRLWWVLTYYGHASMQVLNGGWQRWLSEGRPVTNRKTVPVRGTFAARLVETMRIHVDELKARYADPAVQVISALPADEYLGIASPLGNRRVGHIPRSVSLPIECFFADQEIPRLKPAVDLAGELAAAGLGPAKETVVYCQAGVRTAIGVLVLSVLGWDHLRAYEVSLAEWANRDDTPLAPRQN